MPDPKATVRAANVRATYDAFRLLPSVGRRIMERHELPIESLKPDVFVPVQHWLNALKEIQEQAGTQVVRQVGAGVIEAANFPPSLSTVEAVLQSLDAIYYMNHRGNVGHYYTAKRTDGSLVVRCETPYPRNFEWGLIEGICRNKSVANARWFVDYQDEPPGHRFDLHSDGHGPLTRRHACGWRAKGRTCYWRAIQGLWGVHSRRRFR